MSALGYGAMHFHASRVAGWGSKPFPETVESGASVDVPPLPEYVTPDFEMPEGGLHYRWPDLPGRRLRLALSTSWPPFRRLPPLTRLISIYFAKNRRRLGWLPQARATWIYLRRCVCWGWMRRSCVNWGWKYTKSGWCGRSIARHS